MANYLQLVQKAIRKSGAKVEVPTTIVGASGLLELFVEWVQEAWIHIQLEHMGWHWRISRDLELNITSATDEYDLPATLEYFDMRTVSVYDEVEDELQIYHVPYLHWRNQLDKLNVAPGAKPICFTVTPDNKLVFYPIPDQAYTVRYDGHLVVEELDNTDDTDTPTGILPVYHDSIVWKAVEYYSMHFEDGAKLQEAQTMFRPFKKYFEERELEDVVVDTSAMYGARTRGGHFYYG